MDLFKDIVSHNDKVGMICESFKTPSFLKLDSFSKKQWTLKNQCQNLEGVVYPKMVMGLYNAYFIQEHVVHLSVRSTCIFSYVLNTSRLL